jgi:hypothetical protein
MPEPRTWAGLLTVLTLRALVWPPLALDLLSMAWIYRRRSWWTQAPFLPLPDAEYLEWRMHTAYGEEREIPPAEDVIRYARWRRRILTP